MDDDLRTKIRMLNEAGFEYNELRCAYAYKQFRYYNGQRYVAQRVISTRELIGMSVDTLTQAISSVHYEVESLLSRHIALENTDSKSF